MDVAKAWYAEHHEETLSGFFELLAFKSLSAVPEHRPDLIDCCAWLEKYLAELGFAVERWETSGHPTIFAEFRGTSSQSVLIYNHYDVQPVDPLALWDSPPFEPVIRDGKVFARGAQDNKGQLWYTLKALEYLLKRDGTLPLTVKLLIEGEEEVGSAGLIGLLPQKISKVRSDSVLIVDCGIPSITRPTVTAGLRGAVMLSLKLRGSNTDLHSGQHGGIAFNPNHALVQMLGKLRNEEGRVLVPGFYDGVKDLTPAERELFDFSFDDEDYRAVFGIYPTGGEQGLTPNERRWLRPTLEINGISGGYAGAGFKTVIPAEANAKISCRLVPGQDPERILESLIHFLKAIVPAGLTLEIDPLPGRSPAVRTSPKTRVMQACAKAYSEVFGIPCKFVLEGWSVPVTSVLAECSGAELAMIGLALPDDQIHAPNERFSLERLEKGFLSTVRLLEILGSK